MQSAPQHSKSGQADFPSAAAGLPGAAGDAALPYTDARATAQPCEETHTFKPQIRPSSRARAPRDVADGTASQREAWLEVQCAAREAAHSAAHPFRPRLATPPGHLQHVRGSFDPTDSGWLAAERARVAMRAAAGEKRAAEMEVRRRIGCVDLPALSL